MAVETSVASARVGIRRPLHAVQHLGGDDHRLAVLSAGGNDLLLDDRYFGDVDFDAQVPSSDHHGIRGLDNGIQILQRLGLLNLGNHVGFGLFGCDERLEFAQLIITAHEAQTDVISSGLRCPDRVVTIFLGECGHAQLNTRQIDSLPAADDATLDDAAGCDIRLHLLDGQRHEAVGQHDPVADIQFVQQSCVGRSQFMRVG